MTSGEFRQNHGELAARSFDVGAQVERVVGAGTMKLADPDVLLLPPADPETILLDATTDEHRAAYLNAFHTSKSKNPSTDPAVQV